MPRPVEPGGSGSGGRIQVRPLDFANLANTLELGAALVYDAWGSDLVYATGPGHYVAPPAGWAGGDQAAVTFSQTYDQGVDWAGYAVSTAAQATWEFGAGLVQMALNYLTAEQDSAISEALFDMYFGLPGDPNLRGPNKALAEAIWNVVDQLPEEPPPLAASDYPPTALGPPSSQADTATARYIAGAWHTMASDLEHYFGSFDTQVRAVAADNNGTDVTAMQQWWRSLYRPGDASTLLDGTRQLCAALGDACDGYAGIIDQEHSALAMIALWRAEVARFHPPQQVIDDENAAAVAQARQQAAAAVAGSPQLARVQALTGEVATAIGDNSGAIQLVSARTVTAPRPPAA